MSELESRATNAESYIIDSEPAAQLSCEIYNRTSPINRTRNCRQPECLCVVQVPSISNMVTVRVSCLLFFKFKLCVIKLSPSESGSGLPVIRVHFFSTHPLASPSVSGMITDHVVRNLLHHVVSTTGTAQVRVI